MLELNVMEMVELLSACDFAIQREIEQVKKYQDTLPWKMQQHEKSLHDLKAAREKIYQSLKNL